MNRKQHGALFDMLVKTDPYTGKDKRIAVYIGPYYALEGENHDKKRLCAWLITAWALCVLVFAACGLANAQSSRCFYVLPFFMLLPFPLFYLGLAVIRMASMPQRFTAVDKDASIDRAGRCTIGLMIGSALHTLAEVVFLALGGASGKLSTEIGTALGVLAMGICAFGMWRALKALALRETPPDKAKAEKPAAAEKWGAEPEPTA
ncbi:MAG: hypothetical protein RSI33_08455 [Clostridia bacterium]